MYLRPGDRVRHIFDSRIKGVILEVKSEGASTMSTGGTFMNRKYALIEDSNGKRTWISYDDIMKEDA